MQRRLIAAFQSEPTRSFTVEHLAAIAYPGEQIERKHAASVRRALKNLPGLDLFFMTANKPGTHGWCYFVTLSP